MISLDMNIGVSVTLGILKPKHNPKKNRLYVLRVCFFFFFWRNIGFVNVGKQ